MARLQALAAAQWDRRWPSDRRDAERVIGRNLAAEVDETRDLRQQCVRLLRRELVDTVLAARRIGVPVNHLVDNRGELSRSELADLIGLVTVPRPEEILRVSQTGELVRAVDTKIRSLLDEGQVEVADRLRHQARAFLATWAACQEPDLPSGDDHRPIPPSLLEAHRDAYRRAMALLREQIEKL